MPSSVDDRIDIRLAFYHELDDPGLLAGMRSLLSAEERGQARRFYFDEDRKRYLVTRAMVRTVLARYADVAPEDWLFATNAYGRPELAPGHRSMADGLSFNVSHTSGLIALAVGRHRELGVDVEHVAVRQAPIDISANFFAPTEVRDLLAVAPERRQHRFFEYWTLKEAYLKARGMGLSLPLDGFCFEFPASHSIRITIGPQLEDAASRWFFAQYLVGRHHLLALCAERRPRAVPGITVRRALPDIDGDFKEATLYRRSDAALR